jgi:hypothetical protein
MKKKDNGELTLLQKYRIRRALKDPVLFAEQILGVSLWEREVEILRSIKKQRRTAVKACHGVGKTFTIAIATLWWLARHPERYRADDLSDATPGEDPVVVGNPSLGQTGKSAFSEAQDNRAQIQG